MLSVSGVKGALELNGLKRLVDPGVGCSLEFLVSGFGCSLELLVSGVKGSLELVTVCGVVLCVWLVFVVLLVFGGCGVVVWRQWVVLWSCWSRELFGLSGAVGLVSVCGHWSWASLEPNGLELYWSFELWCSLGLVVSGTGLLS